MKLYSLAILYLLCCQQPQSTPNDHIRNSNLKQSDPKITIEDQPKKDTGEIEAKTAIIQETEKNTKIDMASSITPEKNVAKAKTEPQKTNNNPAESPSTDRKEAPITQEDVSQNKTDQLTDKAQEEEPTNESEKNVLPENQHLATDELNPKDVVDHSVFNELLSTYVKNGKVNYQGLKSVQSRLEEYLSLLSDNPPANSDSRAARLAYWINTYNAFTLKLIIDNYPVKSIKDLHGGNPWDVKWIKIGDQTLSLNNIENDIIRPKFNDPRIHFAVNCAAISCPPLASRAFTEENLEGLLDSSTRAFINDPTYTTIDKSSIKVSKIFDWYKVDFPNLIDFINNYSSTEVSPKASVTYQDYNWKLNN